MQDKKTDRGGYKSDLNADEKVMIAIVRAAELFKKESGAIFKNYGLTFSQYNVLRILDGTPNGKNTITNVSRIMLVSGANMTGIAKRLENNGFLIRRGDANDERITLLEITPKGRQSLKNICEEKDENLEKYMSNFSADEKKEMLAGLKQILRRGIRR
ncbi:MAG: MarR family transcriptional regulator [Deltaproteobacteria bacterium]|nr:MarR family transcriptional regulator [Deltaproteobacteria bacterium]